MVDTLMRKRLAEKRFALEEKPKDDAHTADTGTKKMLVFQEYL